MGIRYHLFLALCNEHKARTGHDSGTEHRCDVCWHLKTIKQEYSKMQKGQKDTSETVIDKDPK